MVMHGVTAIQGSTETREQQSKRKPIAASLGAGMPAGIFPPTLTLTQGLAQTGSGRHTHCIWCTQLTIWPPARLVVAVPQQPPHFGLPPTHTEALPAQPLPPCDSHRRPSFTQAAEGVGKRFPRLPPTWLPAHREARPQQLPPPEVPLILGGLRRAPPAAPAIAGALRCGHAAPPAQHAQQAAAVLDPCC